MRKLLLLALLITPIFAQWDRGVRDSVRAASVADSLLSFDKDSTWSKIIVDTIGAGDSLFITAHTRITKSVTVDSTFTVRGSTIKADTIDDWDDGFITIKPTVTINGSLYVNTAVIDTLDSLRIIRPTDDSLSVYGVLEADDLLINNDIVVTGDIDSVDNVRTKRLYADSANIDTVNGNIVLSNKTTLDDTLQANGRFRSTQYSKYEGVIFFNGLNVNLGGNGDSLYLYDGTQPDTGHAYIAEIIPTYSKGGVAVLDTITVNYTVQDNDDDWDFYLMASSGGGGATRVDSLKALGEGATGNFTSGNMLAADRTMSNGYGYFLRAMLRDSDVDRDIKINQIRIIYHRE